MLMRLLPTDDKCQLRGTTLDQAIKSDREKGLIPCYVSNVTSAFKRINKQTKDRTIERKPDTVLSFLTLCIHAFGTAWSLLGSHRKGQAASSLFQKHFLLYVHNHTFSRCVCFWNGQKNVWWRVRSASHLTSLSLYTRANTRQVICSLP